MLNKYIGFISLILVCFACKDNSSLKYSIYGGGDLVFEISPQDILLYDTTNTRGNVQLHELRLRDDFYSQDSFYIPYPIELRCSIGGENYFIGELFFKTQSQPRLWVNFRFDPSCENNWDFNEDITDRTKGLLLFTTNTCNSIELMHQKNMIEDGMDYYRSKSYFTSYIDTARLAHEILLDPYYLKAIEDSGIPIK